VLIVFRMQYQISVIRLFQSFLDPTSSLERVKMYYSRSRSIFLNSTKHLRRLLILHEIHHGWSNTISYVLHAVMVTGFGSLDEIGLEERAQFSIEYSEPYQGLLTCFRALDTRFVAQRASHSKAQRNKAFLYIKSSPYPRITANHYVVSKVTLL